MFIQEAQREQLNRVLADQYMSPQYIVGLEDRRTEQLLDEVWVDPRAQESRIMKLGRNALAKAGLYTPKAPYPIERPDLDNSQSNQMESIKSELDHSRNLLRDNISFGIDDVAVDEHLGIRSEDSILPPLILQQHQQKETDLGEPVTFLKWMIDYATDRQLLNVWQWHHDYLEKRNNDPNFLERIQKVKAAYVKGVATAIEAGQLHPSIALQGSELDGITITHLSPLSPVGAYAEALKDSKLKTIYMHDTVSDAVLFHEITHEMGGLHFVVVEGATDLISACVFNNAHEKGEQIDVAKSVYRDQIAAISSIGRITKGKVGLYELSEFYAGDDNIMNTIQFIHAVDEAIGLQLTLALLKGNESLMADILSEANGGIAIQASSMLLRRQAEFLEDILVGDGTNDYPKDLTELSSRILDSDVVSRYGNATIFAALTMVLTAAEFQKSIDVQVDT